MISANHVHVGMLLIKLHNFGFYGGCLCLNVSAGIGVLSVAKPMFQEIAASSFDPLNNWCNCNWIRRFTYLCANIIGRIFWASSSDFLGRKLTYAIFFSLGTAAIFSQPHGLDLNQYIATFVLITFSYINDVWWGFCNYSCLFSRYFWNSACRGYSWPPY